MGHAKLSILATAVVIGLTGCGGGSSSSVEGNVPPANTAPVANAGSAQTVALGEEVTVSGSASSDADGDALTYAWEITSAPTNSSAALSSATTESVTFTPDVVGDYTLELVVNDGTTSSTATEVVISAEFVNTAPTAEAGVDQEAPLSELVTLDGSDSDDVDGDEITYSWSLTTTPDGSSAALTDADSVMPTFTPDVAGEYVVTLVVNDGTDDSEADTVTITGVVGNTAPVADAGTDQSVLIGDTVQLVNNSTDADDDTLTSQWTLTVPSGSTAVLSDDTAAAPTFVADVEGEYTASLVVNDGTVDSAADTVSIDAITPELLFFRKSGSTDNYFPLALTSTVGGNIEVVISEDPTPETYAIRTYRLQAIGEDYTIVDVTAYDQMDVVVPFFDGLEDGQVIEAGTEVTFSLSSPLTNGEVTTPTYTFTVEETGETFTASFSFRTTVE